MKILGILRISTVLSLVVLCGCLAKEAAPARPAKTVRLLTVGNSFSANACQFLPALAKAGGHTLIWRQAGIGGGTLAQHWARVELISRNPADPAGRYYPGDFTLLQSLQAEPWDVITLQQASKCSHEAATYRPYARQLYDFIKPLAPQAEIVLHQTWAYRQDDPRFAPTNAPAPGEPTTQQAMYEGLTRAYDTIAAELGIKEIPVGDAFHLADTGLVQAYRPDTNFNFATATYPKLPNQDYSLHAGWSWSDKDGRKTLAMDGHHASVAGKYLAACVFYEYLFKESVIGNRYLPKGISRTYARFLQETAHQAVTARTGTDPLAVPALRPSGPR